MAERLCIVDVYYTLWLNDMRDSKIEYRREFGKFDTPDDAVRFYDGEIVESYSDGGWQKRFRAGGDLEWANPVYSPLEVLNDVNDTRLSWQKPDAGIVRVVNFVRFVN